MSRATDSSFSPWPGCQPSSCPRCEAGGTNASPGTPAQGEGRSPHCHSPLESGALLEVGSGACRLSYITIGGAGWAIISEFRAGRAPQSWRELGRPLGCQCSLPRTLGMIAEAETRRLDSESAAPCGLGNWTAWVQTPALPFLAVHLGQITELLCASVVPLRELA